MKIVINPGTEKQANHNEENAIDVAKIIAKELNISNEHWERTPKEDSESGWYGFTFKGAGGNVEVDIPGVEPERVVKGVPFESPRLYVNGSSWLYGYALQFIFEEIQKKKI